MPGIGPITAVTLVAHLLELGHWIAKVLTSMVKLRPSPEAAARSEGIGPSGAIRYKCGGPYMCGRGWSSATTARYVDFMTAFVNVGSRGTFR